MSSVHLPGGDPAAIRLGPLEAEASEGLDLCLFVIRLRVKNRMLVDSLTGTVSADGAHRVWRTFARNELRTMGREARAGSRRAAHLKELTQDAAGTAWSAHDYRSGDAAHLERRARVGEAVSHGLRRTARDRARVDAILREAAIAALAEVTSSAAGRGIEGDDATLVRDSLRAVQLLVDSERPRSPRR